MKRRVAACRARVRDRIGLTQSSTAELHQACRKAHCIAASGSASPAHWVRHRCSQSPAGRYDLTRGSSGSCLARLGGDEFGLLLENCDLEHARRVADNLRKVIKNFRFPWEDKVFRLSGSIGLLPITSSSANPAEVLAEADAACYAAKEKGRNRVQVYRPGDLELARRTGEMQWVSRITEALQENRFELHTRLITPLSPGGRPLHEVLLRLRNPDGRPPSATT